MVTVNPIEVTGIFFFGSLILSFSYLALNKFIKETFRRYGKIIVILFLFNIAIKIPYTSKFFDGQEYEDSYIYKASARAIYEEKYSFSKINPYYPTSCIYGSLNNCRISGICVTNFLGYPYLISLGYHLFGYQINTSNIISLFFSGISIVFVFIAALLLIDKPLFAFICSFVYITIPIFNIFASTSLTEPLSNAYLILVLLLYMTFINLEPEGKKLPFRNILGLSSIAFCMIFLILVKTANISSIFCLPLAASIPLWAEKKVTSRNQKYNLLISLPVFLIVLMLSFFELKFQTAVEINMSDIGVNPFSFSYFKALASIFVLSLTNLQWYLIYTPFFLAGIFFGLKNKKGIYPIFIFFFYFALYTLHYRSYYFTRGVPVVKDEALRYMISIVSIYSIIVGLGIYYLWLWIRRIAWKKMTETLIKSSVTTLLFIILAVSVYFTFKCRAKFVDDEQRSRVAPILKTLEYLNCKNDALITSEPILFQIYGSLDLRLVDFCAIDSQIPKNIVDSLNKSANLFYLETMNRSSPDGERYHAQFQYIDCRLKEEISFGEYYRLFWLVPEQK